MLTTSLLESAHSLSPEIIALRRAIHAEPELGLQCPLTMAKVREALSDLPLEWRSGVSTTGAVATLRGGKAGEGSPRVLLRGDMDALPMDEKTDLDFASTIPGRMHACGHDTHTAMLTGAARLLCEQHEGLAGTVDFMFQPGEEGHHGARFMLDDGLIDPLPDAAFALHIMPNAPFGVLAGKPGPLMAAADQFSITEIGRAQRPCLDAARLHRSGASHGCNSRCVSSNGHAPLQRRQRGCCDSYTDPHRHCSQRHPG